jgi:hypothetical protein
MEQSGVDPDDLAGRAKTDPSAVLSWLQGDARPTKTQFRAIVGMLRRPAAFFLLPSPPTEAAIPAAFRHPPGRPQHEAARAEIDAALTARRVQRVARWTAERVGDRRWTEDPVRAVDEGTSPSDAAAIAVAWLDWSTAEQRGAASASAVVKLVRAKLEDHGVLALQLSIGEDGCRGFSLNDEIKPLVAVNTAYNPQARGTRATSANASWNRPSLSPTSA